MSCATISKQRELCLTPCPQNRGRVTRNPIYLGAIMVITGLPVYAASLYWFLTSLVLIPIILNRIRMEEQLLTEEFRDAYQKYKETTKKLIPFIY